MGRAADAWRRRMKVSVELESGELEDFLVKTSAKILFKLIDSRQDPTVASSIAAIQQGLVAMVTAGSRPQSQGQTRAYGSPSPFGSPPQGPGNVRPIREPDAVERCFPIEESRHMEAGWACCGCATVNGMQRTACRQCGHPCCVIPPSPSPPQPHAPEPS